MPPKRKPSTMDKDSGLLVLDTKLVDIKTLSTHHKNARRGNIKLIAESLAQHGQFKPIVVNIGTHTGRKNEIAAGNHTYKAAMELGWPTIYASFIDVDEDQLTRVLLADNKTSDAGVYDDALLAELMDSLDGDFVGTGYNALEVSDILRESQEHLANITVDTDSIMDRMMATMDEEAPDSVPTVERDERERVPEEMTDGEKLVDYNRGAAKPDYSEDEDIKDVMPEMNQYEKAIVEIQLVLESLEDNYWNGENQWQVPDLRRDMLVDELPESMKTWAGWQATPDDGVSTYIYNYGLGGTKGLPIDRSILAFNTHDSKFMGWWENPGFYLSKLLASGLKMAVLPDFSFYWTMPRFMHLQGVYRSQWLGRFFQEAGVKVIPRIQYDDEESLKFCMLGIPKNPPYIEISVQNERKEWGDRDEQERRNAAIIQVAIDELRPTKGVIVYGGPPGKRVLDMLETYGAEKIWWENYAAVRRGAVFDKKEGAAKLTAKQKEKVREELIAQGRIKKRKPAVIMNEDEVADKELPDSEFDEDTFYADIEETDED